MSDSTGTSLEFLSQIDEPHDHFIEFHPAPLRDAGPLSDPDPDPAPLLGDAPHTQHPAPDFLAVEEVKPNDLVGHEGKGPGFTLRSGFKILVGVVVMAAIVLTVIAVAVAIWGAAQVRNSGTTLTEETEETEESEEAEDNQQVPIPPEVNELRKDMLKLIDSIRDDQKAVSSTFRSQDNELGMLLEHSYVGKNSSHPGISCSGIFRSLHTPPTTGYYWVRSLNGSAVRVYCDMTRSCGGVTGGWTRVIRLDFAAVEAPCPRNFRLSTTNGIRSCGIETSRSGCASMVFPALISYNSVCGKVVGYQQGSTGAFKRSAAVGVDGNYVDGVSLTHVSEARIHTHIWSFASARSENETDMAFSCPCSNVLTSKAAPIPPSFVQSDYFCDSGVQGKYNSSHNQRIFYNRLWDGSGCGKESACCKFNNPPWFYRTLPKSTTDHMELRLCRNDASTFEDVLLSEIELYVQ